MYGFLFKTALANKSKWNRIWCFRLDGPL